MQTAESYSRKTIIVQSYTQKHVYYLVDFEQEIPTCTCDAYILGKQVPCKHIINSTEPMI